MRGFCLRILKGMEAPNMNSGSVSNVVPPAPAPQGPKAPMPSRNLIITGAVVVIIIALIAVLLHPAVRSWLSSLFGVSLEERSVLVEGMNEDGTSSFLSLKGNEAKPISLPAGLTEYSERNGVRVGIVGTSDVAMIRGTQSESLYKDGEYKDTVAASPDGASIAFAAMLPGVSGSVVSASYVKKLNVSDGSVDIMGVGYAPQYFLRDGKTYLLFTSPEGISVADVADGTISVTPITVEGSKEYAVIVSDDGSYLAIRDALIGKFFIYKVASVTGGLSFSSLRELPDGVQSVAFRFGKLYAVSHVGGAQEILEYDAPDASEPSARHALPASVTSYKLLP